jgi:hypothetical protein
MLTKICMIEDTPVLKPEVQEKLDKLINVKRTSQWEHLQLSEEEADAIFVELENIETKTKRNGVMRGRIENLPHENISVILPDEDFI